MNLTENMPLNSDWMQQRDNAVESVLYLYNSISHRFKSDEKYGDEFVKNNQELIGLLVNAAMQEIVGKNIEK